MLLTLTAYVVIPIYTLLFISGTDWFSTNLSVIGNWPARQTAFFFLGLIIGLYYHQVLSRLLTLLPRHRWESFLLHLAFTLLLCGVTTPYLPEEVPLQSFLHVIFAFLAAVLLTLCLYLTLWQLSLLSGRNRRRLKPYRISLMAITAVSILLLFTVGIVSSALEVIFILSTTFLTQKLYENTY